MLLSYNELKGAAQAAINCGIDSFLIDEVEISTSEMIDMLRIATLIIIRYADSHGVKDYTTMFSEKMFDMQDLTHKKPKEAYKWN